MNLQSDIINSRLAALRKGMAKQGADAAVIVHRPNTRYLSGFGGTYSFIVVTRRRAFFLTDFRYHERVKKELAGYDIVLQKKNAKTSLTEIFKQIAPRAIGFEEEIPWAQVKFLRSCARGAKWINVSGAIRDLRVIKDAGEVRAITRAAAIADTVFRKICGELRPGLTEKQISRRLRDLMEDAGSEGESFPAIVAGGPNSAFPHATPTTRKIQKGDILTLDFGAIAGGYCSDMTRTVFVGEPPKNSAKTQKLIRFYNTVLEAQEKALRTVAPGRSTIEVDAAAREHIKAAGFGDYFGHGTGHGVGLDIHEPPKLAPGFDTPLREGMVITIEPGIYIAGTGGVRIEDLVLVTATGGRRLSRSSKILTIIK